MMTASCQLCFATFVVNPKKKVKTFCSSSCQVMFKKGRKPGPKRPPRHVKIPITTIKKCNRCGREKVITEFLKERSRYWSVCKKCHLESKGLNMKEYLQRDDLFRKCYELILDFQKKRYILERVDLLKLIDIWDGIYPNDVAVGKPDFNRIMKKVYSWFIKERERIIKEEL